MLFVLDKQSPNSLQEQLRRKIVAAILDGQLTAGAVMPSTRGLSKDLGISRTTVVLVYERLVEDGFLTSKGRSGFRVCSSTPPVTVDKAIQAFGERPPDWGGRFLKKPGHQTNIFKPHNWQEYLYPFVYGQPDPALFPLAAWRECSRQAMSELAMRDWSSDAVIQDDPHLVAEIRSKLLPRRGIFAKDEEILITSGAQNALFLIAAQLIGPGTKVGVEDPGYPDARNIFDIHTADLQPLILDEEGARVSEAAAACRYLFLTPSHHSPTTLTMSAPRRAAFLDLASQQDQIIIEDDYESETNYLGAAVPAMKADDRGGRVIYVGSLSKSMFPGLRLGYIVAGRRLIEELRAFRRLMLRHAPSNNQRTTSLFIAQGYHDAYIRKLNRIYKERWQIMGDSLEAFLPGMSTGPVFGGTSFWLKGPDTLDARDLFTKALEEGVVMEPGWPHFRKPAGHHHYFRLGFSSIATERIEEGVKILSGLIQFE